MTIPQTEATTDSARPPRRKYARPECSIYRFQTENLLADSGVLGGATQTDADYTDDAW